MKAQITALLVMATTALLASTSLAQYSNYTTRGKMPRQDRYSSQGFRLALLKPMLDVELKANLLGESRSGKDRFDEAFGFSAGYANLPVRDLGFTVNGSYIELKGTREVSFLRADGNLGYAFNRYFNMKGGLNVSDLNVEGTNIGFDPGVGLQASAGVQVTKNFGLDIGYVIMNQSATVGIARVDMKESGFEIALNGTF